MARKIATNVVLALVVLQFTTSVLAMNISQHFNVPASKIKWGHKANTQADLKKYIEDDTIHMIEADVRYIAPPTPVTGDLNGLVMSHDVNDKPTLTLHAFLSELKNRTKDKKKGFKLDFKNKEAMDHLKVNETLKTLCKELSTVPIYFNADIVQGPNGAQVADMASSLKSLSDDFRVALSIGWTTKSGKIPKDDKDTYTVAQIDEMKKVVVDSWKEAEITFAIRASLLAKSDNVTVTKLKELLDVNANNRSVTLWDSQNDDVDDGKLKPIIKQLNPTRVYLDVPDALKNKLNANGATIQSISTLMVMGSLALSALFSKML